MDPAHGELEAGPAGAGLGLALHLATLATSGHFDGSNRSATAISHDVMIGNFH